MRDGEVGGVSEGEDGRAYDGLSISRNQIAALRCVDLRCACACSTRNRDVLPMASHFNFGLGGQDLMLKIGLLHLVDGYMKPPGSVGMEYQGGFAVVQYLPFLRT